MRHLFFAIKKNTFLLVALLAILCSCERYDFVSDSSVSLQFSSDTISFDTIFSPIGSTTFTCKVYNRSDKNIIVDEVFLAKRNSSPFLMNVDGREGSNARSIRLAKKDSLYIFLEVQRNSTLLLTDSIVFAIGNARQYLDLVAFGQEVVLLEKDTVLKSNFTFTDEKPYLITSNITVDSGVTATVDAGAKLFFGKNCGITVNGNLVVSGVVSRPCIFSHPRYKEPWYSDASGQWQGITVNASGNAKVTHAQLQGARQAFYVLDTLGKTGLNFPQLRLSRSKVIHSEIGINICGGTARIDNCLVANSLTHALLLQGGFYQAYHCTFATYSAPPKSHGAQVALQNFRLRSARDTLSAPLLTVAFGNSIIYGSNANELVIRRGQNDSIPRFDNCIIKSEAATNDPKFQDVSKNDFHLSEGSPAINAGRGDVAFDPEHLEDLDGYKRTDLYNNGVAQDSSMGCYAYHVKE